jgi:hypothetical protein
MAVRTTTQAVELILGGHYDGTSGLQPFIDTATIFVDRIVAADTNGEMTTAALERVECYLSAHFYAHADQITQSRNTGRASGQFMGRTDMGFDSTQYGQTAKRLDTTGLLVKLDQPLRPKASCSWLGKIRDDQLDEDERTTT